MAALHPIFHRPDLRLVDTNCYLLRRDVAIAFCPIWNRKRHTPRMLPPDFELCGALLRQGLQPATNLRHTVNYTVGNEAGSVKIEYFQKGNALMRQRYPNGLPWEAPATPRPA